MQRFIIQESEKANYWVCTDTVNGLVCIFENHNFNDNQQFKFLENIKPDALNIAKFTKEMGDWLRNNHPEKIF